MKKISLATCRGGRGVCFWTASLVSRLVFLRLYCYPTVFTYSDQWLHLYNLYFLFIFYTFFNKLSDSYNDFLQMWCLTICVFRERSNIQIFKYCNVPPQMYKLSPWVIVLQCTSQFYWIFYIALQAWSGNSFKCTESNNWFCQLFLSTLSGIARLNLEYNVNKFGKVKYFGMCCNGIKEINWFQW